MEEEVVCPNCGETNPSDLPYCQYCQWRLRPLDAGWGDDQKTRPVGKSDVEAGSSEVDAPIPDWLREADRTTSDDRSRNAAASTDRQDQVASEAGDDLLAGLAQQDQGEDEEIPEWVGRIMGISGSRNTVEPQPPENEWRPAEDVGLTTPGVPADQDAGSNGSREVPPDSSVEIDQGLPALAAEEENSEIYEWLRQLDATAANEEPAQTEPAVPFTGEVPGWVENMMGISAGQVTEVPEQEGSLPGWLSGSEAGNEVSAAEASGSAASEPPRAPEQPQTAGDSMPKVAGKDEGIRADSKETPREVVPAFLPDDLKRLDVDAVFASMQMPDWLSDVNPPASTVSEVPAGKPSENEQIGLADLPAWVKALRPDASEVPPASGRDDDTRLEDRGPLLGLRGVLPAIPGAAMPSSKPKLQSMRLETSERHLIQARALEDMIAAEAQPLPLKGLGRSRSQRSLRWTISALLFVGIGGALWTGSRSLPLPAAVPIESNAAIQAVQSLSPDAPVLAVFDYEPSTVGEMEATAGPLMDHLLLLKHPRLALVSTSPTGSALAERFMSRVLADRAYVRDAQYVNLGYLPGGLAGVQSFAQDPARTVPLGASTERVWESGVLLGTRRLSDFAAIIVITESVESGRVWIEQTAGARGSSLMIMISSAQAGPMLLPYFDSGQVNGLIAGLNGAAGAEIVNSGFPGLVRRYWDAYSLGLYLAVLLIASGALWQFWIGVRERRIEAGG